MLDGHDVHGEQLALARLPHGPQPQTWRHGNVVLLGDAAHTAHFSIGSGTKLAMEDALALAACLHEQPDVDERAGRRTRPSGGRSCESTQRAAQASLEWFENIGQYVDQEPPQFAFNIMTRSRRVTYDNLRLRDPEFVDAVDALVRRRTRSARLRRRCSSRSGSASWSWQPGRGLGDGHVPRAGRRARRLPPRPPGRQGARRRRDW